MKYTSCPKCGSLKLNERWEATATAQIEYSKAGKPLKKRVGVDELTVRNETWCPVCHWSTDADKEE